MRVGHYIIQNNIIAILKNIDKNVYINSNIENTGHGNIIGNNNGNKIHTQLYWKEKGYKGVIPNNQKQLLEYGSLFVMPTGMQKTHLHKIPKHDRECGIRISLTFRNYEE